jgi:hypothetical protein
MNYGAARSLYNDWRTAELNKKYYACRLTQYRHANLIMELLIAVGTSGAIAAWQVWRVSVGQIAWSAIAAAVALLTITKPLLQLPKQIERYSRLYGGYSVIAYDYEQVAGALNRNYSLNQSEVSMLEALSDKARDLVPDDDPVPRVRLRRRCYEEVNREIPIETLWWPADS